MPAVDPAQRRAEIVMAAFGLLAEGGAEAATMRRVATAAGATTGRVTHYFESRVELLVAALIEVDRRHHQRIAAHDGLEPAARLRAVLEERLPLDTARLSELRVWLALASTNLPEARDELTRQSVAWDCLVRSLLTDANVSVDAAESLVAMVDGLALRLMLDATPRTRRTAAAALDDLLRGRAGDKV